MVTAAVIVIGEINAPIHLKKWDEVHFIYKMETWVDVPYTAYTKDLAKDKEMVVLWKREVSPKPFNDEVWKR